MPLLRKKPFPLAEPPKDLDPNETVYQIRFTKEIFRDYCDYLNRANLYRQRVWMCKGTGKVNLTYEEALVSEKLVTEKVQQFPKELMAPALSIIQYSMLPLKDLANSIVEKLKERLFVGAELYGRKHDGEHPCKILNIVHEGVGKLRYEVAWLNKNKNIIERSEVSSEDLVQKKQPFSRNIIKSFIRESTYRNAPWVLHNELAKNHGISTDIPEELRGRVFFSNGLLICTKKRKAEESEGSTENCKRKKPDVANLDSSTQEKENEHNKEQPIKYPIDDDMVKPSPDDPVFTDRPSPSRDFNVLLHYVGDLIMVWDFFSSFGKLLGLWPYSLKDFENAICHKDGDVVLLVESHAVLLRVLIKDNGEYCSAVQKRRQNSKITMINWTEYLCDFLVMINIPGLRCHEETIKCGHYGLVDTSAKLEIFRELVNCALETAIVREKLDHFIVQRQALGASKREKAREAARKKREETEQLKAYSKSSGVAGVSTDDNHKIQNDDDIGMKMNGEKESPGKKDALDISSGIKYSSPASKIMPENINSEQKGPEENEKELSRKELPKKLKGGKDASEKRSKEEKDFIERKMEKLEIRTSPLGKDRYYNRYWWFRRDGRIFVESSDSNVWGYYSSKEELDALMGSLNCKGERERALHKQLEKYYSRICSELRKRSKDVANNIAADESLLRRSTRIRAPPRESPANAFLRYVNKWKKE